LNLQDVTRLRAGEISFTKFAAEQSRYFQRMARFFYGRASWARLPLELQDLEQLGLLAAWEAVQSYHLRCPGCRRGARTEEAYEAHVARQHPELLEKGRAPRPRFDLLEYVHRKVGRAMDHEVYRYVRRERFHGDMPVLLDELPEHEDPHEPAGLQLALACEPTQEHAAELRLLIDRARAALGPRQYTIFLAMIGGERVPSKDSTLINLAFINPILEETTSC